MAPKAVAPALKKSAPAAKATLPDPMLEKKNDRSKVMSPLACTTKSFGASMKLHSQLDEPVLPDKAKLLSVADAVKLPPCKSTVAMPMSRLPVPPDPTEVVASVSNAAAVRNISAFAIVPLPVAWPIHAVPDIETPLSRLISPPAAIVIAPDRSPLAWSAENRSSEPFPTMA